MLIFHAQVEDYSQGQGITLDGMDAKNNWQSNTAPVLICYGM